MHFEDQELLVTYRNLNTEAIRRGATGCLYVWQLLRHMDNGKGYVYQKDFLAFLKQNRLKRHYFYTALKHPLAELFFRVQGDVIEYRSLLKVCNALEIKPGRAVHIPLNYVKTLKNFTAYAYSSLFANVKGKAMIFSRERIQEITGLSVPTQIKYEKLANVEVTPNVASINIPYKIQNNHSKVQEFIATLPCAEFFHTVAQGNVYFQLPNSYRITRIKVFKGKPHRANKLIKLPQVEGMEHLRERAKSTCLFFNEIKPNVFYTDERDSYIRTNNYVTVHGQQAKLFRYNFYAPTKYPEDATPGLYLDKHKVIRKNKFSHIKEQVL